MNFCELEKFQDWMSDEWRIPGSSAIGYKDGVIVYSHSSGYADVEEGHRSTTMSLIANISLAVERRLEWDAQKEEFIGDDEANRYLSYEYREPWKLEV